MAPTSYHQPMAFHGPLLLPFNQKYCSIILILIVLLLLLIIMALLDVHFRMNGHPSFNIICPKRIHMLSLKLRNHFVSSYTWHYLGMITMSLKGPKFGLFTHVSQDPDSTSIYSLKKHRLIATLTIYLAGG